MSQIGYDHHDLREDDENDDRYEACGKEKADAFKYGLKLYFRCQGFNNIDIDPHGRRNGAHGGNHGEDAFAGVRHRH